MSPTGMTTPVHPRHQTQRRRASRPARRGRRSRRLATAWWSTCAGRCGDHGVDQPTAYLLMQTLVGAWPIDADRLQPYVEKAIREAKQHTTWTDRDPPTSTACRSRRRAACRGRDPSQVARGRPRCTPAHPRVVSGGQTPAADAPGHPRRLSGRRTRRRAARRPRQPATGRLCRSRERPARDIGRREASPHAASIRRSYWSLLAPCGCAGTGPNSSTPTLRTAPMPTEIAYVVGFVRSEQGGHLVTTRRLHDRMDGMAGRDARPAPSGDPGPTI